MEKEQVNVSLGNSKVVTVNDRAINVKKLGLLKYVAMTKNVKSLIAVGLELLRKLLTYSNAPEDESVEQVPVQERATFIASILSDTVEQNLLEVIKLLDLCIPELGFDYICEEVGLTDALELLKAIVEVNKLEALGEEIKNLLRGLQLPEMK